MNLVVRSQALDAAAFREAFSELPSRVRDGVARTGLLPEALWGRFLDMAPAPFAEFWVAEIDGVPVGRIGANRLQTYPDTGAIGFFEVDTRHAQVESIAAALLDEAKGWLRGAGMSKAVGPLNLSTYFPYRFRTRFDDEHAFAWEPNQPPEYPGYFRSAGFQVCEKYTTTGVDGLGRFLQLTRADFDAAAGRGYSFRPFRGDTLLETEVPVLHRLSLEGFKENFLYESISLEAFRELYVPIAKKMDFSHCCFALDSTGKEVGFFFGFLEGDNFVIKTITVLPEARGQGLSNSMVHYAARSAFERGIDKYIVALVREGIRSESYAKKGNVTWVHEYELYEAPL